MNQIIEKAGAEAQYTTLGSAGAVQDAIGQTQSAYGTELNKTLDNVDATARANVERLRTLVQDLQSGNAETIRAAGASAQQLVNSIPFANKNPQVTSYAPRFIAPVAGQAIQLRVRGNFVHAFEKKQTPLLVAGEAKYQPNLITTQELGFAIPVAAFPSATSAPVPLSLELEIPYERGVVFKNVQPGVFRLLVTTLPPSPVKSAVLTRTIRTSGFAYADRRAPDVGGWGLNSYDCQDHSAVAAVPANPGWTIVPSSVQVVYDFNKNPSSQQTEVAISLYRLTVKYSTRSACVLGICNGCGSIVIHVEYREQQPVSSSSDETKALQLGWGDVVVEPVPRNDWKLSAALFDGAKVEFTGSDHSNRYLLVDDEGTNLRIQVRAPERLADEQ